MAQRKGGLGKGIGALFAENAAEEFSESSPVLLPVNDIIPNKNQPRSVFEDSALTQLSESIAEHGVLQPLIVRPMSDGSYQIVAGERRWRAAKMAGLSSVPVVIKTLDDSETSVVALIENLQREDLNPLEEALGIRQLIEEFGLTQEQAAQQLSKSRPAITNALRLLSLPEQVLQMLVEKRLSSGHARAILSVSSDDMKVRVAQDVINRNLSVRDTEKLTQGLTKVRSPIKAKEKTEAIFTEIELALSSSLGRNVKVANKKNGGKLEIEFFDKDDLLSLVKVFE